MSGNDAEDMGYVGDSRILWSSVEGVPQMTKPPETSRELAEAVARRYWDAATFGGWKIDSSAALIDLYVKVKEAEARIEVARWMQEQIKDGFDDHAPSKLADRYVAKLESSLAQARAELEKL